MKTQSLLLAIGVILIGVPNVHAQSTPVDSSVTVITAVDSVPAAHSAIRSAIDGGPAAAHRAVVSANIPSTAMADMHQGMGQSQAMMGVGIAGLVAGALIGGDTGKIIMVGSAVIGLYGLYKYLQ